MIFDWNLRSRKHRTNADLINRRHITKKLFSSSMQYIVLWLHLWRYRINANIKTWYPQKPHILTFTLIPSSFFSDHCVKLYRWMCITFQMPLVYIKFQFFQEYVQCVRICEMYFSSSALWRWLPWCRLSWFSRLKIAFKKFESKLANFFLRFAFKVLKANRWKIFESKSLAKFWKLAGKFIPANCFQNFENLSQA